MSANKAREGELSENRVLQSRGIVPSSRFNSQIQGDARSNKSALPYRPGNEVESNLDASNPTHTDQDGNITDDPITDNFKNKSQLHKGGRIIINKKGVAQSHHDNIKKLRERLSEHSSTRLDTDIDVSLPGGGG